MIDRTYLELNGAAILESHCAPYSSDDMCRLLEHCDAIPTTRGLGTDNVVECGRVLIDPVDLALSLYPHSPRTVINPAAAQAVLGIVSKPAALDFWRQVLAEPELRIRRAQTNVIRKGGRIGLHVDSESNPDYLANIVIGLSDDYGGGDYVAHVSGCARRFRIGRGTVLVSLNGVPHEIEPVTAGERRTLVVFVSAKPAPAS
jgi:hypothetical protein